MRRGKGEERLEAPAGWMSGLTRVGGQAGRTALVIAAERHEWDVVLKLASAGADINAVNEVTSWGMRLKLTVVGVGVGGCGRRRERVAYTSRRGGWAAGLVRDGVRLGNGV